MSNYRQGPSKKQLEIIQQSVQQRFIKIEILDYNFNSVEFIEGKCISGNISINADTDIRRTGNIVLTVSKESEFQPRPGSSIWLDKYIRVWVRITNYSLKDAEPEWINCGIFLIDAPNYYYDLATRTLTLSLIDLMSKLTGVRNGYLEGIPVILKEGSPIIDTINSILKMGGFSRSKITGISATSTLPIDLEYAQGSTLYDLLKGILDLYPGYEMYFDTEGIFNFQKIPTGKYQQVIVDDAQWNNLVLNENISVDFQNVKNSIEVYGRVHDPAYYSVETTIDLKNTIELIVAEIETPSEKTIYGFSLPPHDDMTLLGVNLNGKNRGPLVLENGYPAKIYAEQEETYYCVQYFKSGTEDRWLFLGHLQAKGYAEDNEPKSPFNVNGSVGRIRLPLFGGEYDNIYSDELAVERAKYELYLRSHLNDTVQLTCIPVYWLDVNSLAIYTPKQNRQKSMYLIKSISFGLGVEDTMNIVMMRLYVDLPKPVPPIPPRPPRPCSVNWNSDASCVEWNNDRSNYIIWNSNSDWGL